MHAKPPRVSVDLTYLSHLESGSKLERIHLALAVAQAAQAAPHLAVVTLRLSVDLVMPPPGLGSLDAIVPLL